MPNASDRKSVRKLEKDAASAQAQNDEYTALIMSTPSGRAWMVSLLDSAHVFSSSFTDASLRTAFLEGERNVGLRLLSSIMAKCPDAFILMMQERNHRDASRDTDRSERSNEDDRRDNREPSLVPTNIVIDGNDYLYRGEANGDDGNEGYGDEVY